MDVWFWSLWKDRFSGGGHEEHSDSGKNEERHAEGRGEKPHAWLFKLPRRARKEEDRSKKHGVGEILAGAIARITRLVDPPLRVGPRCRRFRRAADLVKIRHKWVRVGGAILEWLLGELRIVGLLHVGRKTLGIKARELFVAGMLRGEELHEHRGVNDQSLTALHIEQRGLSLHRIGFIHQTVAPPGPSGGFI